MDTRQGEGEYPVLSLWATSPLASRATHGHALVRLGQSEHRPIVSSTGAVVALARRPSGREEKHMNQCKNCRWWDRDLRRMTPTQKDTVPSSYGFCEITASGNDKPEYPETLAYGLDYEDYGGILVTAPNFGCVQYEPRVNE